MEGFVQGEHRFFKQFLKGRKAMYPQRFLEDAKWYLGSALALGAAMALGLVPAMAGHAPAGTPLWGNEAKIPNADIFQYDIGADVFLANCTPVPTANGRGITQDPFDGNLWYTFVSGFLFSGDGFIHKTTPGCVALPPIPFGDGPGGVIQDAIGAMDIDPDDGHIWAAGYQPVGGVSFIYKVNRVNGAILQSCHVPFGGGGEGNDTITVAKLPGLGGSGKYLLTDAGEPDTNQGGPHGHLLAVDEASCVGGGPGAIVTTWPKVVGMTGIDFEGGQLIAGTGPTIDDLGGPPFGVVLNSMPVAPSSFLEDITLEATLFCDPDPRTQGYYHRQCLGLGLITPGRNGRGPKEANDPDFEKQLPDVNLRLQATVFQNRACEDGLDADPPSDPCERALKQYTALLFNIESGRLQETCEIDLAEQGCSAGRIGDLVDELAALINSLDPDNCKVAASCAGAVNEGGGIVLPAAAPATGSVGGNGADTAGSADPELNQGDAETPGSLVDHSALVAGGAISRSESTQEDSPEPAVTELESVVVLDRPVSEPDPVQEVEEKPSLTIDRHLAIMNNASAPEKVREASREALLTALGGGYDPARELEIVKALADRVDVALQSLLVKHLEDIRHEAEEMGKEDLVKEANRLLEKLEMPKE